ncbi:MAG: flagellar export chaperone FliS [Spirochaetaceae bacterium]|nr:flagellar export chaperone FliS [Spirochaetaceae bacterium]
MSYQSQALNSYKETRIKTASQGSLILMLYDEAIKQISNALVLMPDGKVQAKDIEKVNSCIIKVQDIVTELMASLDLAHGGEIASNLLSIYSFFNQQLLEANIKKQVQPLIDVKGMMEDLRQAWQQVISTTVVPQKGEVGSSIDVAR